jgi:hypothetical protein
MTEQDWLTGTDPHAMLDYLREIGEPSARKVRLFAAACCRRVWGHLKDRRSRRLVEVAEAFADGTASERRLRAAFNRAAAAQEAIHHEGGDAVDQSAAEAVLGLREDLQLGQVFEGVAEAVGETRAAAAWERIYRTPGKHYRQQEAEHRAECDAGVAAEQVVQASFLRDLVGNPFRRGRAEPSWRTRTAVALALPAYEERDLPAGHLDPDRLAVLADSLEEAGCTDAALLGHLRGPGPHVRGCWAVDAVLGKE